MDVASFLHTHAYTLHHTPHPPPPPHTPPSSTTTHPTLLHHHTPHPPPPPHTPPSSTTTHPTLPTIDLWPVGGGAGVCRQSVAEGPPEQLSLESEVLCRQQHYHLHRGGHRQRSQVHATSESLASQSFIWNVPSIVRHCANHLTAHSSCAVFTDTHWASSARLPTMRAPGTTFKGETWQFVNNDITARLVFSTKR